MALEGFDAHRDGERASSSSEGERANLRKALADEVDALASDSPGAGRRASARRSGRRRGNEEQDAFDEEAWIGAFGVLKRGGNVGRVAAREAARAGERRTESGSGRIGLVATKGVNACEVLLRERVTAVEGTFRSQGACLAQLMGRLRAREETHASRAAAPATALAKTLLASVEEREEVLLLGERIGVDDLDAWLEFAAYVKHNTVTRTCRPTTSTSNGIGDDAGYVQCSMVMFDVISACNHSCDPNAEVSAVSEEGEVTLYSLRPIEAGEEITICYGRASTRWLPARCRRRALRRDWHFECTCEKCKAEIASGLALDKPMARPWDILDPRWFYCTQDYTTGFETHFDGEGNLLSLRRESKSYGSKGYGDSISESATSRSDLLRDEFGSKLRFGNGGTGDDDFSNDSGSGFTTSTRSDSSSDSSESSFNVDEDDKGSSASEDEDVMRWHERWRSRRMKTYSVKNVGLYTPFQLYHAMQRCQIRQDHWQFLVVREALISQIMNEAAKHPGESQRPACPTLGSDENGKERAFKLVLNHCRSLARMTPNSSNFVELFATLENMIYWHSTEGWWYHRTQLRARRRKRKQKPVDDLQMNFFEICERSRWWFRLQNLRDAVHADVLAWNMSFGKSPCSPF